MELDELEGRLDADGPSYRRYQAESPNFMTPEFVAAEFVGPFVIELSKGKRLRRPGSAESPTLYGVSVVCRDDKGDYSTGHHPLDGFDSGPGVPGHGAHEGYKVAVRRFQEATEFVKEWLEGVGEA